MVRPRSRRATEPGDVRYVRGAFGRPGGGSRVNQETPLPARAVSRSPNKVVVNKKKFRWGTAIGLLTLLFILSLGAYAGYLYVVGKNNLHKIADHPVGGKAP